MARFSGTRVAPAITGLSLLAIAGRYLLGRYTTHDLIALVRYLRYTFGV